MLAMPAPSPVRVFRGRRIDLGFDLRHHLGRQAGQNVAAAEHEVDGAVGVVDAHVAWPERIGRRLRLHLHARVFFARRRASDADVAREDEHRQDDEAETHESANETSRIHRSHSIQGTERRVAIENPCPLDLMAWARRGPAVAFGRALSALDPARPPAQCHPLAFRRGIYEHALSIRRRNRARCVGLPHRLRQHGSNRSTSIGERRLRVVRHAREHSTETHIPPSCSS